MIIHSCGFRHCSGDLVGLLVCRRYPLVQPTSPCHMILLRCLMLPKGTASMLKYHFQLFKRRGGYARVYFINAISSALRRWILSAITVLRKGTSASFFNTKRVHSLTKFSSEPATCCLFGREKLTRT